MAVVYDRVNGLEIQHLIAHQKDVQGDLTRRASAMGAKAQWLLSAHRQDGHARIMVEKGDIDRYIVLDDSRGLDAAMSIEYGRKGDAQGKGASRGIYVLHDATGLPR